MIVLHHNDMDGRAAAAIIRLNYPVDDIEFIEMNYGKSVPFDLIEPNELVYIVDFSLQKPGDWEKLLLVTDRVVWIDHHGTAIKGSGHQHNLKGIRKVGECGALLTWRFFNGHDDAKVPLSLQYINDWDCWIHNMVDTIPFKLGMDMRDIHPSNTIWDSLLSTNSKVSEGFVEDIIEEGGIVHSYQTQCDKEYIEAWGYSTKLENYTVFAVNKGRTSSLAFGDLIDEYDICCSYVFNGLFYTISLYSNKDNIDCGAICKKRGGGGHKGASGFQSQELPEFLLGDTNGCNGDATG
jgi:oligoribonuclease NrnB/cAMP/cGMP phosphodiesterase (DHH superfamily)